MQEIDIISNALQQAVSFGIICCAEYAICKEPCWLKSVDERRKNIEMLEHYQGQPPNSLCSCHLCVLVRTMVCKCRNPTQYGSSLSKQCKIKWVKCRRQPALSMARSRTSTMPCSVCSFSGPVVLVHVPVSNFSSKWSPNKFWIIAHEPLPLA